MTVVVAGVVTLGLVLGACGAKPSTSAGSPGTSAAPTTNFKACMVTDTGGIDDRSFNASAWAGMQAAQKAGKAHVSFVQSKSESDYAPNIAQLSSQKCDLIVTVGGLMGTATTDAAKKSATQHFAIVDSNGNGTNVQGLQFNTAQGAFLAGYLAAGYSKTGKVATYGGLKIPPVTIYMDGFWEGVQYYNQKKGKSVQVLGWSETSQSGVFAGSFTDQSQGQQLATNFIQQGADVVFPVAGGTAFKNVGDAVQKAVEDSSGGTFATKDYVGDLSNGGVGISPFHNFDSKIDSGLKSELTQIQKDIIAGTIKITSPSQPKG
jgi:basic membrane protein A